MPRLLSLMSGNFDDPPASESDREAATRIVQAILDGTHSADEISPSGELYRAIRRFHRGNPPGNPTPETMASEQESERREEMQNDRDASPLFVLPHQPERIDSTTITRIGPPMGSAGHRSRSTRTNISRYLGRVRYLEDRIQSNFGENSLGSNGLADLQYAGRQLEQASSNLRALLDDPVPELTSPTLEPQLSGDSDGRRRKRRKLDSEISGAGLPRFNYGRYGQVEPGELRMEIASCDGGIFDNCTTQYPAENVLRSDATVYCTKANRCNLILQHQGATVFCLKELIIKAPHSGYTAPVQEGMVFISMTSDNLLTRTAQYQIQYSPPNPRPESRPNEPPRIMSLRHNDDGTITAAQNRARRLVDIGARDEECDYRTAQIPQEFTPENAPPFIVTTECSDSESEDAPSRSAQRSIIISRSGSRPWHPTSSDESDGIEDEEGAENSSSWSENYFRGTNRRGPPRRLESARSITLSEAAEASQIATQEAVKAVGGELMAPHARFFIERDKSKCTVRFDPPVSGRFILLKMWSPHHDATANIDIQSVVAKGFAGPRYFPATSMR